MTRKGLVWTLLAYLALWAAVLAVLLCGGCTHVESYHDSRAWLVGSTYTRTTHVTASDAKQTTVSPQTDLALPVPMGGGIHVPARHGRGGATLADWAEVEEYQRTGGVVIGD